MTVAAGIIAPESSYVDPKVAVPVVNSSHGAAMIYAANITMLSSNGGAANASIVVH